MRPSASLCQSSRHRLLTPLVLLLGVLCIQTAGGLPVNPDLGVSRLNHSQLVGGTPLALNYYLTSQCSDKFVQIRPAKKRGRTVDARAENGTYSFKFAALTFESHSPSELRIVGSRTGQILCFSKRGKLRAQYPGRHSDRCLFHEKDKDGRIMLQSVAQPSWYVGFNKKGRPLRGYSMREGRGQGSGRLDSKRRAKKRRHRHRHGRRGRKIRHNHGRRGSRKRNDSHRIECFYFVKEPANTNPLDLRNKHKQEYSPMENSNFSKYHKSYNPKLPNS